MNKIVIDGENLNIEHVYFAARHNTPVELCPRAAQRIEQSRKFVEKILEDGKLHYGINTGFGDFQDVAVSPKKLKELQINIIRSHSAGTGEPLPQDVVRAMMLLRANALCRGNSGVRMETVEMILQMLNRGVHPLVPSRGSVGASGDLAPLAHIALSMIGEGKSCYKGQVMTGGEALKSAGIEPLIPVEKEGLALINGTQLMTGIGSLCLYDAEKLLLLADGAGAMSIEGLLATAQPFIEEIQQARPHKGQMETAENMRKLLKGSGILESHKDCGNVQDAYSLRCIPAVHGAAREALRFAREILTVEINSSVDNPLVFPEKELVVSGGNFHGAPVALTLETLGLGLSFAAGISERRIDRLVNRHYSRGLPPFLAHEGGLHSGFMIAHYTAAALTSEIKVLCHPACCDSIPTSAGQEDHVSMGSISALKLMNILDNAKKIIAIEYLCAAQALDCRKPLKPAPATDKLYKEIRKAVPFLKEDRVLSQDIETIVKIIYHEGFIRQIEEVMR